MLKPTQQSRRVRVFWIPERHMIPLLRMHDRLPEYVAYPVLSPLPDGAEIIHCWLEHRRGAFAFMVQHESFDEVPEGQAAPDGEPVSMSLKSYRVIDTDRQHFLDSMNYATFDPSKLSREELVKLREQINTAVFDLERQPRT